MPHHRDWFSWAPSFSSDKERCDGGRQRKIVDFLFPDTIGFGVGLRRTCRAKAYLNQHWIPGSPRRPALVPSVGFGPLDSLKAGAGHPPIRGVQGLARTAEWTAPSKFAL
jgi:hypothetical protein